ncbi:hypothetical protein GGI43DRAFT_404814 [Trichoderma evansii]
MWFLSHRTLGISISMLILPPTYLSSLWLVALIFSVSSTGRWSSQRMTLRSLPSLEKSGPVTGIGSSVSLENTEREQVASKPMPLIWFGLTRDSCTTRRTHSQMQRQMSVVDCS